MAGACDHVASILILYNKRPAFSIFSLPAVLLIIIMNDVILLPVSLRVRVPEVKAYDMVPAVLSG